MDLTNKPESSMGLYHDALVKYAKRGEVVRMYSTKYDFGVQRRKVKARHEATREAMLMRARAMKESEDYPKEQIEALYVVANEMAHVVNSLTSAPAIEGAEVEEKIQLSEKMLETLLEEEETRFENVTDKSGNAEGLHLCRRIHAYDRARTSLENYMYEYARSEQIAELALVGGADNFMAGEQSETIKGFGDERLFETEREFTAENVPFLPKMTEALHNDDLDALIEALNEADEIFAKHMRWVDTQIETIDNIADFIDVTEVALNEKSIEEFKFQLSDHETYLSKPIMYALAQWVPLFKEFTLSRYSEVLEKCVQTDLAMRGFTYEAVEVAQYQPQQYYAIDEQQNQEQSDETQQQVAFAPPDDGYDHSDNEGNYYAEQPTQEPKSKRSFFSRMKRSSKTPDALEQQAYEQQAYEQQAYEQQAYEQQAYAQQSAQQSSGGFFSRMRRASKAVDTNEQQAYEQQVFEQQVFEQQAEQQAEQQPSGGFFGRALSIASQDGDSLTYVQDSDGGEIARRPDEIQGEESASEAPPPMIQYQLVPIEGAVMAPESEIDAVLAQITYEFAEWCTENVTKIAEAPMADRFSPLAQTIYSNLVMMREKALSRSGRYMHMVATAKKVSKERRKVGCWGR
jgi:hypothetical protein